MITQEEVKKLFDYKDGKLYWKDSPRRSVKKGSQAGGIANGGYRNVMINTKSFREHRIIFLLNHGYLPDRIDHINRNPADNRIENLREVTQSQNMMNSIRHSNSISKYKGVYKFKNEFRDEWRVAIQKGKLRQYLGAYSTEQEAALAYNKVAKELFGEYARLNNIGVV